jgi:hypothetical protein
MATAMMSRKQLANVDDDNDDEGAEEEFQQPV